MARYTEKIRVRLTPEELAHVQKCAGSFQFRNGKANLSAYLRELLLRESGYQKRSRGIEEQLKGLKYELRKIGTNINQVARKVNADLWTAGDIKELQASLNRIEEAFAKVTEEVSR